MISREGLEIRAELLVSREQVYVVEGNDKNLLEEEDFPKHLLNFEFGGSYLDEQLVTQKEQ